MREWFWPVAPVAAIIYCIAYAEQFTAFITWAQRFVH